MSRVRGRPFDVVRSQVTSCFIANRGFSERLLRLLGCNHKEFKAHIESILRPGMTMANITKVWTIGYIDRDPSLSELERCHYTNFAPLRKQNPLNPSSNTVIPFTGDAEMKDAAQILTRFPQPSPPVPYERGDDESTEVPDDVILIGQELEEISGDCIMTDLNSQPDEILAAIVLDAISRPSDNTRLRKRRAGDLVQTTPRKRVKLS